MIYPNELTERVCSWFQNVTQTTTCFTAKCPAHDDRRNSLCINQGTNGSVVLKCQAGCDTRNVLAAVNKTFSDLYPPRRENTTREIYYDYTDENGNLLYQVIRKMPEKKFFQRTPDGNGGWIWSIKDVRKVLYRLPEVIRGVSNGQCIFIVEGEKDANNLARLGLCATTNSGGAKKWQDDFADFFRGSLVAILPDNDEPGFEHAQLVASKLFGKAKTVKIVTLPNLPPKGDVSNWLSAGGTKEELLALVEATPEWKPDVQAEINSNVVAADRKNLTELGNAERLVEKYRHLFRFCNLWGKWLHWTGQVFEIDESEYFWKAACILTCHS